MGVNVQWKWECLLSCNHLRNPGHVGFAITITRFVLSCNSDVFKLRLSIQHFAWFSLRLMLHICKQTRRRETSENLLRKTQKLYYFSSIFTSSPIFLSPTFFNIILDQQPYPCIIWVQSSILWPLPPIFSA